MMNSSFGHVTLSRQCCHKWTPVVMTNFLISPKWPPQINFRKKSRQSTYLKALHFWSAKQKIRGGSKAPPHQVGLTCTVGRLLSVWSYKCTASLHMVTLQGSQRVVLLYFCRTFWKSQKKCRTLSYFFNICSTFVVLFSIWHFCI